jgi:hypothetical protein
MNTWTAVALAVLALWTGEAIVFLVSYLSSRRSEN